MHENILIISSYREKSFEEIQKPLKPEAATSDTAIAPFPLSTSTSSVRIDLLHLMLPALCHLTAEQEPRDLLLTQGAMETCGKYFSYQWIQFMEKQGEQPEVRVHLGLYVRLHWSSFLFFFLFFFPSHALDESKPWSLGDLICIFNLFDKMINILSCMPDNHPSSWVWSLFFVSFQKLFC